MPSLQGAFRWEGDLARSSVTSVGLTVRAPEVGYETIFDSNGQVRRVVRDATAVAVSSVQTATDQDYSAALGVAALIGAAAPDATQFLRYLGQRIAAIHSGTGELSEIEFTFDIDLHSVEDELLDRSRIGGLVFLKGLYDPARYDMVPMDDGLLATLSREAQIAYVARNAFLINRAAFDDLVAELQAVSGSTVGYEYLLYILGYLVDLTGPTPVLSTRRTAAETAAIEQILNNIEMPDLNAALALIKSGFPRLFEFPISTRDVRHQIVAGSFTLKTADAGAVTLADFALYDLSLEYTGTDADGQALQQIARIDWNAVTPKIKDNTIPVSFSDAQPIFPAGRDGTISLYVRTSDSMVVWTKDYRIGNPALEALKITVPLAGTGAIRAADRLVSDNLRLRGQVLDLSRKAVLKDALVAIQARAAKDAPWRVVASGACDAMGNFSMGYPFGDFTAAQALVSLMPNNPVAIPIRTQAGEHRTIAADFLYLLLKEAPPSADPKDADDDCHCDAPRVGRLPDQSDLIESDDYMQDLGNGCLNLSAPNRTLREYSYQAIVRTSDPDVVNYTLVKDQGGKFSLIGDAKLIKRRAVGLNNPIRWQDAPDNQDNLNFYQTVSVATGHVLHYKSQFRADGYSLGDLLYSLPLAPGQVKQIAIFDASHSLQGAESQQLSLTERLAASLVNDRDITDQLGGTLREGMRGRSAAHTEGMSVGVGAAASMGSVGASLGVAGGFSNSNSDAEQDSGRSISQFFAEKLRNSLSQNADSFRQQNASVITTVSEGQRYAATTEVIANHNHCHSMTMMYFEVLRHYAIFQELVGVEECVFVPLLMTNFTPENVYKWQDVLAPNLLPLPSNTYLPSVDGRHPLARAFDAIARIKTNYADLDFPEGRYSQEPMRFLRGQLGVTLNLPRPRTKYDRILSLPLVNTQVTHEEFDPEQQVKNILAAPFTFGLSLAGGPAMKTVTETVQVRAQLFDQFMTMDANYQSVPPAQAVRVTNFNEVSLPLSPLFFPQGGTGVLTLSRDRFFDGNELDRRQWEAYAALMSYPDVYSFLSAYFRGKLISEWDTIFYNDIAPALAEKIIANLNLSTTKPERRPGYTPTAGNTLPGLALDFSSTSRYNGGTVNMTLNIRGTSTLTREQIPDVMYLTGGLALANLGDTVTFRLDNLNLHYSTAHVTNLLFSGHLGDDLQDGTMLYLPITAEDQRYPRREDRVLADKLIEHLNSNLEYYNKVLWTNLDPDRRYLLLDGFNIQVYNEYGVPVGLKSLASVVKNELLTIAGNALVLPVAAGLRVSKSHIVERTETGATQKLTLMDHYRPAVPMPPYRLSVPTRGVFAEAMMGRCDSCEKVQEGTSQDWTKFTTDTPTGINALTPATVATTDWRAAIKDMAAPLVRMQDAPAAPAPAAGLTALSQALMQAGAFRDITGLDKNQSNAIETLKSNNELAAKMAEAAKGLAIQAHNTENSDKITGSIDKAKKDGTISKEEHADLTKQHIEQKIDGGESAKRREDAAATKTAPPTLTDAAVQAVSQDKEVDATETDAKGTTRKVQVKPRAPAEPGPATTPKFFKTLYFRALDCYGDSLVANFDIQVFDAAINKITAFASVERDYNTSIRIGFATANPTIMVRVTSDGEDSDLILKPFSIDSKPFAIPAAQVAVNIVLEQQSQKFSMQTKETKLTAEKIAEESSKEGGGELSFPIKSIPIKLAGKIAAKSVKEKTETAGKDEMRTFDLVLPTEHFKLTMD